MHCFLACVRTASRFFAFLCVALIGVARTDAATFSTLYTFEGIGGAAVATPAGPLVFDAEGRLYGVASNGGPKFEGVVFELSLSPKRLTVLHSFADEGDGGSPEYGVVFDNAGNLFGTTAKTTSSYCDNIHGCGTVFELDPGTRKFLKLHNFLDGKDGAVLRAGLTFRQGVLYGTAQGAGSDDRGTVYQIDISTRKFKTIHAFTGEADGADPDGGVIFDSAGTIYGTTSNEGPGCTGDCGTIYKLNPATGLATTLHGFRGPDGSDPQASLTLRNGVLYGTTYFGGRFGYGTVFAFDIAVNTLAILTP